MFWAGQVILSFELAMSQRSLLVVTLLCPNGLVLPNSVPRLR